MKRISEQCNDTAEIWHGLLEMGDGFALIAMCLACPCVWLLASLLQLSKRTRRVVWDTLANPQFIRAEMSGWPHRLAIDLKSYKHEFVHENPYAIYADGQAAFILYEKYGETRSCFCKVLGSGKAVLIPTIFLRAGTGGGDGDIYTAWELYYMHDHYNLISWYPVASALALLWDRICLEHAQKSVTLPLIDADCNLFMAV
jgi:hypothetical protein